MDSPYRKPAKEEERKNAWVNQAKSNYNTIKDGEKLLKVASYLPESIYMEVIQKVLPALAGKKINKQGYPLKPTIADYIRELVIADIAKRNKQSNED